jgi:ADP-ribose pyrophosphatase
MVDPGEHVSVTLKREFGEEALNALEACEDRKRELQRQISEFFSGGYEVSVVLSNFN